MTKKTFKKVDFSLVLPIYNEEHRHLELNLRKLISFLKKLPSAFELIVVNDGSNDNSLAIVNKFKQQEKNVTVISYKENRGKGFAVKKGVLAARGEKILFCDADFPVPLAEIINLLNHLNSYDVVIGSRQVQDAKRQTWLRACASSIFAFLARMITKLTIKDFMCGFKGFKKAAAKKIFTNQLLHGYAFDVEILLLAKKENYHLYELPIKWMYIPNSHISPLKEMLKALVDLARIFFFYRFGKAKKLTSVTRKANA